MTNRFLLYIDILGFSDLVTEDLSRINDLYEVIASLNALKDSCFRAIIFSDTILVYNIVGSDTASDRRSIIMFLCEFAQDLQHRLTKRGIVFRAVLVYGGFTHYELNSVPCFFGPALIEAYGAEKDIQAIGLFMHKSIVQESSILFTEKFNENFDFVFITQSLESIEYVYGGEFPMDRFILEETELIDHLVPEFLHIEQLYRGMSEQKVERIRIKYENTWMMFNARYPKTAHALKNSNFDWGAISCDAAWIKVLTRFPVDYSYAVESRSSF